MLVTYRYREETLYDLLGVTKRASAETLRSAYRRLARSLHPDVTGGDVVKTQRFRRVTEAYRLLADPAARAAYDAQPHGGWREVVVEQDNVAVYLRENGRGFSQKRDPGPAYVKARSR